MFFVINDKDDGLDGIHEQVSAMASAPFILTQSHDLSMKKILVATSAIMSGRIESRARVR
jgi:hypothetical protein